MDKKFKAQTIAMVDKHLTVLRNNMVASVEAQKEHTVTTLQGEYLQLVEMEKLIEVVACTAVDDLNKVHAKHVSSIHMLLSNLMAPITERKLALANRLNEFEDQTSIIVPVEDTPTATLLTLSAPKRGGFFRRSPSKVKAAHG